VKPLLFSIVTFNNYLSHIDPRRNARGHTIFDPGARPAVSGDNHNLQCPAAQHLSKRRVKRTWYFRVASLLETQRFNRIE
jgi:hypothetical protein